MSCFPALNRVFRQLKLRILGSRVEGVEAAAGNGAELYVVRGESQVPIVDAGVEVVVIEHVEYGGKKR